MSGIMRKMVNGLPKILLATLIKKFGGNVKMDTNGKIQFLIETTEIADARFVQDIKFLWDIMIYVQRILNCRHSGILLKIRIWNHKALQRGHTKKFGGFVKKVMSGNHLYIAGSWGEAALIVQKNLTIRLSSFC